MKERLWVLILPGAGLFIFSISSIVCPQSGPHRSATLLMFPKNALRRSLRRSKLNKHDLSKKCLKRRMCEGLKENALWVPLQRPWKASLKAAKLVGGSLIFSPFFHSLSLSLTLSLSLSLTIYLTRSLVSLTHPPPQTLTLSSLLYTETCTHTSPTHSHWHMYTHTQTYTLSDTVLMISFLTLAQTFSTLFYHPTIDSCSLILSLKFLSLHLRLRK